MTASLLSPNWYRVADLKPELKSSVGVCRQRYRGQVWYVLFDESVSKQTRISVEAYQFLSLVNGTATVNEAWTTCLETQGDNAPSQDDIIQLLASLYRSDLMDPRCSPDYDELQERYESFQKSERLKRFINPMALRFRILDPERFLNGSRLISDILFSKPFLLIWLAAVIVGLVLLGVSWDEFSKGMSDKILSPSNLVVMALIFPILKVFHEFGHAYAIKKWGGEVHDMGVMFLVFMPVPYVDASSSWAFRNKYHRMVVGASGMLVEIFIAAVAIVLWSISEPGVFRAICYNIIFIAGVSTLLFNANPLLKFDGYYIFMDWLEMPNFAQRSNAYFASVCRSKILRTPKDDQDWGEASERAWCLFYAVASFFYRIGLSLLIAYFVATEFFFLGVLLAVWALSMSIVWPIIKLVRTLFFSSEYKFFRGRAYLSAGVLSGLLYALFFLLPLPHFTVSEGVVWIPEKDHVRTKESGFITAVTILSGKEVGRGDVLLEMNDSDLESSLDVLKARESALYAEYRADLDRNFSDALIKHDELIGIRAEIAQLEERLLGLSVSASDHGVFILQNHEDLEGRYFKKGDLLGYLKTNSDLEVRVAIDPLDIGFVREQVRNIEIRFADDIFTAYGAEKIREIPEATNLLPSLALTIEGGGELQLDPNAEGEWRSYEPVFFYDLRVIDFSSFKRLGERVYVRFDHGYASIYEQYALDLRSLFVKLSDF